MTNKKPWECPENYLERFREIDEKFKNLRSCNLNKSHVNSSHEQISEEELSKLYIRYLGAPKYQRLKNSKQS